MLKSLFYSGVLLLGTTLRSQTTEKSRDYGISDECCLSQNIFSDEILSQYIAHLQRISKIQGSDLKKIPKIIKDFVDYYEKSQVEAIEKYQELLRYKQEQEEKAEKNPGQSLFLTKLHEALQKYREEEEERRSAGHKSTFLKLRRRSKRVEYEARDKANLDVNKEKAAKTPHGDPDLTRRVIEGKPILLEGVREIRKLESEYFEAEIKREVKCGYKSRYLEIWKQFRAENTE